MHRRAARVEAVPARPLDIAWVASDVVANRWSASAAGSARPRPSVLACHSSTIGVPRTSIRTSERRRIASITECASARMIPSPAAAAAIAAAWLVYGGDVAGLECRCARRTARRPVVGSMSCGPTSQRSRASADGEIPRWPASGWPGAATIISRERRNGTEAIVVARSGPGWGPSAMSARRCSSMSANDAPGTVLDGDLEARAASA